MKKTKAWKRPVGVALVDQNNGTEVAEAKNLGSQNDCAAATAQLKKMRGPR